MSKVLIAVPFANSTSPEQTLELLTVARRIAGDSGSVIAAFTGSAEINPETLSVDEAYVAEDDALGDTDSATFDATTDVITALVNQTSADVILFARTDAASVIAPRLAVRIDAAFARDCISIEKAGENISVTRPVHGGNAVARFTLEAGDKSVVVVRPGVYEPAQSQEPPITTTSFDPTSHIRQYRSTLIRTVQEAQEGVRLEDAEVVVSGGRGLGGPEPFEQIRELAELLGGAVGASRAACDAGWIDHSHQVGLTGKSVSPRLYLSFGISGASQHMAGCSSARNIVAVNTDPDASIFSDARFGVVGDWSKVLPALISAVRDLS